MTNSLLESKIKDQGMAHFFKLQNSSRDMKHIDIFIELTNLQKTMTEKNIIIDRLKTQLKESQLDTQRLKSKQTSSPVARSPNRTLNEEL